MTRKVLTKEQNFLSDLRSVRKISIRNVDRSESDPSKYQSSSDDDFIDPNVPSTSKNTQIRTKLPTLGLVCDKYGTSDLSAAAIASAVLKNVGIITTEDPSKIVDKNKVREKKNGRLYKKTVVEEHVSLIEETESIYEGISNINGTVQIKTS
ncbi:unnamed protein product [Psylliodes chrysocephalus]|uniref:Uncharacterized protein n=1 Tax=Psylliodes chrysocephalus TaxID=3402493 RepID=A0A9P0G726_9CUCU|nr:unnamed protein product [Psylliodes chrysocephala]